MIQAIKTALWQIIRVEGIEVTNQNIDWLLERAAKSLPKVGQPIYIPFFNDDTGEWDVLEDEAIAVEFNERGSWSVCDGGGFRHRLGADAFLTEGEAIKEAESLTNEEAAVAELP